LSARVCGARGCGSGARQCMGLGRSGVATNPTVISKCCCGNMHPAACRPVGTPARMLDPPSPKPGMHELATAAPAAVNQLRRRGNCRVKLFLHAVPRDHYHTYQVPCISIMSACVPSGQARAARQARRLTRARGFWACRPTRAAARRWRRSRPAATRAALRSRCRYAAGPTVISHMPA